MKLAGVVPQTPSADRIKEELGGVVGLHDKHEHGGGGGGGGVKGNAGGLDSGVDVDERRKEPVNKNMIVGGGGEGERRQEPLNLKDQQQQQQQQQQQKQPLKVDVGLQRDNSHQVAGHGEESAARKDHKGQSELDKSINNFLRKEGLIKEEKEGAVVIDDEEEEENEENDEMIFGKGRSPLSPAIVPPAEAAVNVEDIDVIKVVKKL